MKEISYNSKKVVAPEYIDELTPAQYEAYLSLAMSLSSGLIDRTTAKVKLISLLLGLKVDYTLYLPGIIEEIESQTDFVDSFFDGDRLTLSSPINLLPTYANYTGPDNWLNGLPFGKFVEILSLIEGLAAATEDEVVAIYEGIARILYHIPEADKVPVLLTVHAPMFFSSVWHLIQTQPININGGTIDFRILFQQSKQGRKADDHTGWTGIMFEVAKEGVFGALKEVEACDVWKVLLYLYKCKFEYLHENNTPPK